ncbi:MAG TPA: cation diffusion facilitator family transporter [Allosphingosinicella sp.]|jgi:cobalt-zinc-cadmium efflux system protein|nr:cation diffusion facilitator family transporter [Allosphingosinicella sp.]
MSLHHHHGHHDHGHGHGHASADFGRAFLVGTVLNLSFVAVEACAGLVAGSMALLADAGHNLSDVLGLVVAWGATALARKAPTERFTYGLRKSSVLAALLNAVFLLVAIGAVAFESIYRFSHPEPVSGVTVTIVAAIGILVNTATALMFARGRKHDINVRSAFVHMAADAAIAAGVVVAGLVMLKTGWLWLDPAVSLAISALILAGTWGLLRDAVSMSLDAVPADIDPADVHSALAGMEGVSRVHDLHIWPMSTTEVALTCHLVVPAGTPGDAFLHDASDMLHRRFRIAHATIQVETVEAEEECRLASPAVV